MILIVHNAAAGTQGDKDRQTAGGAGAYNQDAPA